VNPPARRRLIVGITGASGAVYGVRLLQRARELALETHLNEHGIAATMPAKA
jgi:4-hydroxy-3-polyprenylbenzoate decarboxylase